MTDASGSTKNPILTHAGLLPSRLHAPRQEESNLDLRATANQPGIDPDGGTKNLIFTCSAVTDANGSTKNLILTHAGLPPSRLHAPCQEEFNLDLHATVNPPGIYPDGGTKNLILTCTAVIDASSRTKNLILTHAGLPPRRLHAPRQEEFNLDLRVTANQPGIDTDGGLCMMQTAVRRN